MHAGIMLLKIMKFWGLILLRAVGFVGNSIATLRLQGSAACAQPPTWKAESGLGTATCEAITGHHYSLSLLVA